MTLAATLRPPTASATPAHMPDPVPTGRCRHCGSSRLTQLGLTLTDGTEVLFASCRDCERRAWTAAHGDLGVLDVLSRTVKPGAGHVPATRN